MTRRIGALVIALVLAVGLVISVGVLTGEAPAAQTGSSSPSASVPATHSGKPSARHSAKPVARPGTKPVTKALAGVKFAGTGSRKSKPVLLDGDYVLRDSIVTKPGCHWQVFIDGYDTAPMDEVLTNKAGSTSSEVPLIGLQGRRYTIRIVATSCGSWSVNLARA